MYLVRVTYSIVGIDNLHVVPGNLPTGCLGDYLCQVPRLGVLYPVNPCYPML